MIKLMGMKSLPSLQNVKLISTSVVRCLDQDWRKAKRLPTNPNVDGPLTNFPDFTYMDGRPTPLGKRQMKRVMQQRDLAQKIVTGTYEIDYAIKRHQRLKDEEVKAKQDIMDGKLKPKGHFMLKKK